jgi:hypothetical protein
METGSVYARGALGLLGQIGNRKLSELSILRMKQGKVSQLPVWSATREQQGMRWQ